ncbi:terminase small subunit [Aureimonas fodinaquatilis]|uniref:Terminase small subunit n=1 Tax=Aureimonas fodinaquatilis TaxID=2565783 RepID=A0A5B0DVQ9_9HYPH|nr:terminase small subunit [Aureimonas fodinaquatilis]KAA0970824.1 terminase small subunit [Aureimonas fodinaquatilis]
MALTARQQRFVEEYLIDLNATQAAIRAGYSAKNADVTGPRMLGNVGIAAEIAERKNKHASELDLSAGRVLRGLLEEATRTGEGSSHGARVSAWGLLGKYHKLFTDRIEAEVSGDITITDARSKLQSLLARQAPTGAAKRDTGGAD